MVVCVHGEWAAKCAKSKENCHDFYRRIRNIQGRKREAESADSMVLLEAYVFLRGSASVTSVNTWYGDRQGSSQNAADRPCAGSYSPLKYPRKSRCSVNRMFAVLILVRRQKPAVAIARWKQKHPQLLNRRITPISNMMKSASHKAKIDCCVGGF